MMINPSANRRFSNLATRKSILLMAVVVVASTAVADREGDTSATVPRINGHPDLNGYWLNGDMDFVTPIIDKEEDYVCVMCRDPESKVRPPRSTPPKYKPEYQNKVAELSANQVEVDKSLRCGNPGLPRIGPPDSIVHAPGRIAFLYSDLSGSFFRIIPTDGRPHWEGAEESYLGNSVGRWEGDTLIIEAVNFIDDFWIADNGAFHSPSLKVIERLTRVGDTIEYQAIVEDPEVLVEPWHLLPRVLKLSDTPMLEPVPCVESDMEHVVDGSHHDNPR